MRTRIEGIYLMKKLFYFVMALSIISVPNNAQANTSTESLIEMTKQSHNLIGLYEAHKNGYTGKDQVVVIIDSGISPKHEAFSNKIVDGYCTSRAACGDDFMKTGADAASSRVMPGFNYLDEHGSMTGAIAAGNQVGTFPGGIAPDAKVISINNQNGNLEGLILAFDWIIKMKSKYNIVAVNASFGIPGTGDRGLTDQQSACPKFDELSPRIKQMYDLGISFVAASGNGGAYSNVNYPACSEYAIAVGALTYQGNITNYSDIGKEVDILAPADVLGAKTYNGYWMGGGTSSATPVVVGAIALLKQANPNATVEDIKKALASSGIYKNDVVWGNLPVLNIPKAIDAIKTMKFTDKTVVRVSASTTLYEDQLSKIKLELETLKKEVQAKSLEISTLTDKNKVLENEILLVKKQNTELNSKVKTLCLKQKKKSICK